MNIRCFIGASSALLIAWLGATFVVEVPAERYRQQGHSSSPITGKAMPVGEEVIAGNTIQQNP
jgi:hypothetical protein